MPTVLGVWAAFALFWYGFLIAAFVFYSIGLFQLAKTHGLANPWFAFVPVLQSYLAGELADTINRRNGKSSSWKIVALILHICSIMLSVYSNVMNTSTIFYNLLNVGISIVTACYLYKVYEDHSPSHSTVFTVLTALFGLHPFFIFAIRNKPSVTISYQSGYRPGYGIPYPYGANPYGGQTPYPQHGQSYGYGHPYGYEQPNGYNHPPQGYGHGQPPSQYNSGYPQTPPYVADDSRPYSNPNPQYGVQPFADTSSVPEAPFVAGSYNNGGHVQVSQAGHTPVPEFNLPGQENGDPESPGASRLDGSKL